MPGTALGVEGTPEKEKDKVCSQGTCILDGEPDSSDGDMTVQQGHVREGKGAALAKMVRGGLPEEVIFELRDEDVISHVRL